ncbi:MAG TPA: carboxymuconolactone decarboxylase family protein [Candidatus Methylomirabilis sp.]|nr:carboxymuconolactone decarboxylase family protein [Candidatus Methylomirabilis sp.]
MNRTTRVPPWPSANKRGATLKTRELLTFSMLASLGGCEPQLAGHVATNLAAGKNPRVLVTMLSQLVPFIECPRTLNALTVVYEGTSP